MNTYSQLIKVFGINNRHFNDASNRVKSLIITLALSIVFSPLVAGIAISFCIYFFVSNVMIASVLGLLLTSLLLIHHRTLLSEIKASTITYVLAFSVILAAFISLPLKFYSDADHYKERMVIANEDRYNVGLANAQKEQEVLFDKKAEYEKNLQAAANVYSRQRKQPLADARRIHKSFMETFEDRKDQILAAEIAKSGFATDLDTSQTAVFKFYIQETFSGSNQSDFLIYLTSFFLFLFIEGSPALIGLALLRSEYAKALKHDNEILKVLIDDRNVLEKSIATNKTSSELDFAKLNAIESKIDHFKGGPTTQAEVVGLEKYVEELEKIEEINDKAAFDFTPSPREPIAQVDSELKNLELDTQIDEDEVEFPGFEYINNHQ